MDALARVAEIGVGVTTFFAVLDSNDAITYAHDDLATPSGHVRLIPQLDALVLLHGQPAMAWVPGRQVAADSSRGRTTSAGYRNGRSRHRRGGG